MYALYSRRVPVPCPVETKYIPYDKDKGVPGPPAPHKPHPCTVACGCASPCLCHSALALARTHAGRASQTHLQIAKGKAHTISHDERRAASKAQPHQSTRTYTHARSDKITHAWTVSNGLCQCVGPTLRRGHTRPRRSSAPPWPRRSHPARPALRQPHHPRHSVRMSWKEARVQPTGRGRGAWSQGEPPRTVTARAAMPSVGPALGQRTHPTPAVHAAAGEGVGEAACKLLAGGDGPEGRQRAKAADTAM